MTTLPRTGLWASGLDLRPSDEMTRLIGDLEARGLGALWLSEGTVHDPFVDAGTMLAATDAVTVGIGVAVVHGRHPRWMRASARAVEDAHPGRFVLLSASPTEVPDDQWRLLAAASV